MSKWIKCADQRPPQNTKVRAMHDGMIGIGEYWSFQRYDKLHENWLFSVSEPGSRCAMGGHIEFDHWQELSEPAEAF